jgi:NAD(P)-dependent dehydrogenase (short-subunit alcohol dehydrogenase family)
MKKTVLITGANGGIGRATVNYFAKQGWQVIAGVRNIEHAKSLWVQPNVDIIHLDVTDEASIQRAIAQIKDQYQQLDVVVNNAGYGLTGAFETFTSAEINQQYAVNVFGIMAMCRAVLPLMRQQRTGTIVNISSMGGKFAVPFYGVYCSTKFAVEGFSEGLFYEVVPFGIKVKVVEPGAVNTEFYGRSKQQGSRTEYQSVYHKVFDHVTAIYHSSGNKGNAPEHIAAVIYRAATDSSVRLRYAAGWDAKLNIMLTKLLPHWLVMAVVRRRLSL